MGTAASKTSSNVEVEFSENVVSSAPVLTPQIRRLDLDPRSPSSGIARTPIEVLKTPLSNNTITMSNNSLDVVEDININKQSGLTNVLDPRSPTTEFHRTPIVIENTLKLRNKNLDNARMPLVTVTPMKPKKLSERVVKKIYSVPEISSVKITSLKQFEGSPIKTNIPENKRHSVVGLLETNIDFVETDLDVVIQSRICENHNELLKEAVVSDSGSDADIKAISVTDLVEDVYELVVEANDSYSSSNSEFHPVVHNPSSTCPVSAELDLPLNDELKTEHEIQITKDETNVNALSMLSVEELNTKLTNLIYEDKQSEASPKISKPIITHRTPLGERDTNSQQRKSISKLRVSDKPTKCPVVGISKIPVFKEKRFKENVNLQCENIPSQMQQKHTQWAAEDSIII